MTLNVNYTTDLEVKSDRTQIDRAFFNRRFKPIYDELLRIDDQVTGFADTEDTLIQIGLDRMNQVLGPMLATVQAASELGFLTCRVTGESHSMVAGEFVGWHVTEGAQLLTPTHFLLALDEDDANNWGILSLDEDGWHPTTGELSTHVVYANITQTSLNWQIAAHAGVLPAMEDLLVQSVAAKNAAETAQASVAGDIATLQGLIDAVQEGPVASVAGKTGAVTLTQSDISGLVSDLSAKASITSLAAGLAGKQATSAKLDALNNLSLAANKLIYATDVASFGTTTITDFTKALLAAIDAGTAHTALGFSAFIKTLLDDVDAAAARATLGVAGTADVPVKASGAEVTAGTDDVKFVTSLQLANAYTPKSAAINTQTGTSYTLVASDNGKIVRFTNAGAVTCSLPASGAIGHNTMIEQFGAGAVTINVVTNATRRSFGSKFKLAGQYATCSVFCELNSDGGHAEWNVSGNLIT